MPAADAATAVTEWLKRAPTFQTFRDYHEGRHQLRFSTKDFEAKYGDIVRSLRENLIPGVVAAYADKCHIEAWSDNPDSLDTATVEGLDRLHARVAREKYLCGCAFALVWPGPDGTRKAHFHRADQIVPVVDPTNPSVLLRAAKLWIGEGKLPRVNVYYPDRVERYALSTGPLGPDDAPKWAEYEDEGKWAPYSDDDGGDTIPHDMGAVPVCWFKFQDDGPTSWGRSVIADAIPLQDGLNTSVAQMVVLGEAYARPFWYLLNYQANGDGTYSADSAFVKALQAAQQQANQAAAERSKFDPTQQSIFTTNSPGPFGQLDPPDLTRLLEVQNGFAEKIARVTGVPTFYLFQSPSDVPSGEALRKLQVRLDTSVRTSNKEDAPVWRGLKALLGMDEAPPIAADPNPVTKAERLDEAMVMKQLGYPLEACLRHAEGAADVTDLLAEAKAEHAASADAVGRALAAGQIPARY